LFCWVPASGCPSAARLTFEDILNDMCNQYVLCYVIEINIAALPCGPASAIGCYCMCLRTHATWDDRHSLDSRDNIQLPAVCVTLDTLLAVQSGRHPVLHHHVGAKVHAAMLPAMACTSSPRLPMLNAGASGAPSSWKATAQLSRRLQVGLLTAAMP
jgi:hypothetical protein